MRWTVEEIVAEGDDAAVRLTVEGTLRGEFLGMQPTPAPVRYEAWSMVLFRGGKIAAMRSTSTKEQGR